MSICIATNIAEGIKGAIREQIQGMHTFVPGKIVSYDPASGTATVQPIMQITKPDGTKMDYPQISGVPVTCPQGGGQNASIGFPIKAGDGVMLLAAEKSLDYWMYGRETDTDLSFDLSNSVAIPGLFNSGSKAMQEANNNDCIVIMQGDSVIKLKGDGVEIESDGVKFAISGGKIVIEGDIEVDGKITATGEVESRGKKLASHTHTDSEGGQTSAPN